MIRQEYRLVDDVELLEIAESGSIPDSGGFSCDTFTVTTDERTASGIRDDIVETIHEARRDGRRVDAVVIDAKRYAKVDAACLHADRVSVDDCYDVDLMALDTDLRITEAVYDNKIKMSEAFTDDD